ncbi:MAG TPA: FG-GAP-like repeat-containing protein [Nannocystaceae bacterium]|nr:FG-GAP-like repeat-containing protein [Nannocystaceae bacterium]
MAGRFDLSIWNLTLVAAAACGPLIPAEDGGGSSISEGDSGDDDDDDDDDGTTTHVDPCIGDDCPECRVDADCPPGYYCDAEHCQYYSTCGVAPGQNDFRCSPWYECYSDADCPVGEQCWFNYCEPGCDAPDFQTVRPIAVPHAPVVDLVFVDVDGQPPAELAIATTTQVDIVSGDGAPLSAVVVGEDLAALATADVDGDGDLDLVAGDRGQGGQLFVLTNDGTGAFTPGEPIATLGPVQDFQLADPENDGAVDAYARTDTAIVRHLDLGGPALLVDHTCGAMTVAGWSMAYSDEQSWWLPVATPVPPAPTLLSAGALTAMTTATLDLAGDPDVVGVRVDGLATEVDFWAGPIGELVGTTALDGVYPVIAAADLYGDGIDEAVVAGDGSAIILTNTASSCQGASSTGNLVSPTSIAAGDLDGDGIEEIAVSDGQQILVLDDASLGG